MANLALALSALSRRLTRPRHLCGAGNTMGMDLDVSPTPRLALSLSTLGT